MFVVDNVVFIILNKLFGFEISLKWFETHSGRNTEV